MTHFELVERAGKWLKNTFHCRVVLNELVAYTRYGESPDSIGWVNNKCILVECKTSVADFIADRKKIFRHGIRGMGHYRFYLAPEGLLNNCIIPDGWGLYEVVGKTIFFVKGAEYTNAGQPPLKSDRDSEIAMLLSALSRKQ